MLKIATWNVNSLNVRLPQVLAWLAEFQPDILALQETKVPDEKFPLAEFKANGYEVIYQGQKAYNGVAILSRHLLTEVNKGLPAYPDPQCRIISGTLKNLRVINVYVPNGQSLGSEKYAYKLLWLSHLQDYVQAQLQRYPRLVILGDFNIAPADLDVHDPAVWVGQVLCSEPERTRFQALLALGLADSFRLFTQADKSFSWWDYRTMGLRRNHGLRIDHILISEALRTDCQRVYIDKIPRHHVRPADHTPVVAEFNSDSR